MKIVFVLLAAGLWLGCASIKQEIVTRTCNKEGAYQQGYNDARNGNDMNNGFASLCPPEVQDLVKKSYREGYTTAQGQKPTEINVNVGTGGGGVGPGYACKEAFGKQVCGYNCIEAYGDVKCAHVYGHNCLESYGEIKCGLNCRDEYGELKCDKYE